jgi:hypothetical protein
MILKKITGIKDIIEKIVLKRKKIRNSVKTIKPSTYITDDEVKVRLPGLEICMVRKSDLDTPHEVTVVIPRAEIRTKYYEEERYWETEVVYNSITVVSAPRHPQAGPPAAHPEIPPGEKD